MLALAQVEDGHDGRLLVLRRVPLEDLGDELLVLRVELERDVGVVVGGVAVLRGKGQSQRENEALFGEVVYVCVLD